jgi:transcriptional regulator with XRE-family HTH domain
VAVESKGGVETVEVKKRRLRVALKQARVTAKLTQKAVAEDLVWSTSKIVRIEQGTVPVAPTDVRAMLHLYKVDADRVEELVELAKEAKEDKGWDAFNDVLPATFRELVGNEPAASVVYKYEPSVVPGLLQIRDYTRALLRALGHSESDIERRLEVRNKRQEMLDQTQRPDLNFIVGEAALVRPVGGREVMREQIAHLLEVGDQPGISLWLLPFAAGAHSGLGRTFTVLQFGDPLLSDLLYLENAERESISRDEEGDIKRYLNLFVELEELSEEFGTFKEHAQRVLEQYYGGSITHPHG